MTVSRKSISIILQNTPRYFWLLFFIFSITAGLLFFDRFRTYSSEVTVIVMHRNDRTAAAADQVVNNIAALPRTLSFYDQLLKRFPEVNDPWSGMSDDERKTLWSERISVDRVDRSGLIRLKVDADTATDASLLAEKSTTNLFQIVGRYYDIRTEFDIRTVDEPIGHVEFSNPAAWFFSSLVSGLALTLIVSSFITLFSRGMDRARENMFSPREKSDTFSFPDESVSTETSVVTDDSVMESKPDTDKKSEQTSKDDYDFSRDLEDVEMIHPSQRVYPQEDVANEQSFVSPEESRQSVKPAASSSNLPFLEDGVSLEEHLLGVMNTLDSEKETADRDENAPEKTEENPSIDVESKKSITAEPTPEELKRRLNQLLKGDM